MSYWILLKSGILFSRTTVQCVTYLYICTDANKQRFEVYDKDIKERPHKKYTKEAFAGPNSTKPNMEMWSKMAEYGEDFQYQFNKLFDNPAVKEADEEFTPYLYNNYVNMELTLY